MGAPTATQWPMWLYQLVDGLAEYDYLHPKLFAQYAGSDEYQKADCPCHLLGLIPSDVREQVAYFMAGYRVGQEAGPPRSTSDTPSPESVTQPRAAVPDKNDHAADLHTSTRTGR